MFLSGCLFLRSELKLDLSQVHNSHGSFARLTAPYPSAFIQWGVAGFGFFFIFLSIMAQIPSICIQLVSRRKTGKKQQNSCLLSPEPTRLTSEGRCYSDAKRGAPIAETLPIKGMWIEACFSDPTASIQPSWIDAADLDWAAAELLGAATASHSTEYF